MIASLLLVFGISPGISIGTASAAQTQSAVTPKVEIGQIVKEPATYAGVKVRISGMVKEVLGEHLLVLQRVPGKALGRSPEMLVLMKQTRGIKRNAPVEVSGVVSLLSATEATRVSGLKLNSRSRAAMKEQSPVIVATRVAKGEKLG